MLSEEGLDDAEVSRKFDFTWLLAFFNRNMTVLHSIVPRVAYNEMMHSAVLTFYPRNNIFTFLRDGIKTGVKEHFLEFLVNLIKTVAADVGVDYGKTVAPNDIVEMEEFMEQLYSIRVPNLDSLLKDPNFVSPVKFFLSQVDNFTFHVNWTEYLLLVAPVEVHPYILSNPELTADLFYTHRLDYVLRSATPRTLTNFVITHYIFSWLTVLDAKYRKLIHGAKPIIEQMIREISDAFKDQLNENEWMGDEFRKGVFKKLDHMKSTLLYDEISANDTALDNLYSEHVKIKDKELPFLPMLDEVMYAEKKMLFYKLIQKFDPKKTSSAIAFIFTEPISAMHNPDANTIMIPLGFVQYPIFDPSFPWAFNYGSVGFTIAHEILHGFENEGIEYDYEGERKKWYKDEWIRKFAEKAVCYIKQYNNKTIPIFNRRVDGVLKLQENMADNEGMKIAYRAFKEHRKKYGEDARTDFVEDFTNDQLFFLSSAMEFCTKDSDLTLYYDLRYSHSSSVYRMNNVALNTPGFASSFFCPPGSQMNPHERCSVW